MSNTEECPICQSTLDGVIPTDDQIKAAEANESICDNCAESIDENRQAEAEDENFQFYPHFPI